LLFLLADRGDSLARARIAALPADLKPERDSAPVALEVRLRTPIIFA